MALGYTTQNQLMQNPGMSNSGIAYANRPNYSMPNMGMANMGIPNMGMPNMGMPNMGMPNMNAANTGLVNTVAAKPNLLKTLMDGLSFLPKIPLQNLLPSNFSLSKLPISDIISNQYVLLLVAGIALMPTIKAFGKFCNDNIIWAILGLLILMTTGKKKIPEIVSEK